MAFNNGAMRWVVGLNTSRFQSGVDQVKKSSASLRDRMKNMTSGINAALGSLIAVAAFKQIGLTAINTGSQISDLSEQLRINAEALQVLTFTASKAGVDQSSFERAIRNTTMRTQQAVDGNTRYQESFKRLGIDLQRFANLPAEQKLEQIAQAYARSGKSQAAFTDVASILGERAGPKMLEVLRRINDEGLTELEKKARDAGAVMNNETIAAMDELADSIGALKTRITVLAAEWIRAFKDLRDGSFDSLLALVYDVVAQFGWAGGKVQMALEAAFRTSWAFITGGFKGTVASIQLFFASLAIDIQQMLGGAIQSVITRFEALPLVGDKFRAMNADISASLDALAQQEARNNIDRLKGVGDYIAAELAGMDDITDYATRNHEFWMEQAAKQRQSVAERVEVEKEASEELSRQARTQQVLDAQRDKARARIEANKKAEESVTEEMEKQIQKQEELLEKKKAVATFDGWGAGGLGYDKVSQLDDDALAYAIQQMRDGRAQGDVSLLEQEQRLRAILRRLADFHGDEYAKGYADRQYNLSPKQVADILQRAQYDPNNEQSRQTRLLERIDRNLERNLTPSLNI